MSLVRKYIWTEGGEHHLYVELQQPFTLTSFEKVTLRITADYKSAAFVNGSFAGASQLADVPEYKTVNTHDITSLVKAGENVLTVKAFHLPEGHFQCRVLTPSVSFEILCDGEVLAVSNEHTLARKAPHYVTADEAFTPQIGDGYDYTFVDEEEAFRPATVVEPDFTECERPMPNTTFDKTADCKIIAQGVYKLCGGNTTAEKMQNAWLRTLPLPEINGFSDNGGSTYPLTLKASGGDGIFLLGDLGKECAGYPYLKIETDKETECYLGWGEHLNDLRIRTRIHNRNFAIKLTLKKGVNDFTEYLRRIGCRYMAIYLADVESATVHRFGLVEELYPLKKPAKDFGDRLLNQIYETSRRTLELCMHEHYEDCPWREQALYGMDSRNQMLFGYTAFEEYQFPRTSMTLIARTVQEDGLIPICSPSVNALTIPSFATYWIIAVDDNVKADYNEGFINDVLPAVEKVIKTFIDNTFDGVVHTFGKAPYWNFHEWSWGLEGGAIFRDHDDPTKPDGLLTALVYKAAKAAAHLESVAGNTAKADELEAYAKLLADNFYQFYDAEKGLFRSYIGEGGERFHEYTQALFLWTGALNEEQTANTVAALTGKKEGLVALTLAGLPVKYEALLANADCLDYVVDDMCEIFGTMLYQGATSFWETALGEADFGGAGSLCHGWSAVACYVLDNYYNKK